MNAFRIKVYEASGRCTSEARATLQGAIDFAESIDAPVVEIFDAFDVTQIVWSIDRRVLAIRDDEKVGYFTGSTLDECFSDAELAAELDRAGIRGTKSAVRWARKYEATRNAYADDIRASAF